ncbi:MAG: hypothetical protein AAF960_22475 [Bacteroidota bacterium]
MSKKFELILMDFVRKAKEVELALQRKFSFQENPYLLAGKSFRKKGEIVTINDEQVEIWYHGSGCTFNFSEGIELNYSIAPISENTIKISPWSIHKFTDTSKKYVQLSQKEVLKNYEALEKEGIMSRYMKEFDLFEIHEDWLEMVLTR